MNGTWMWEMDMEAEDNAEDNSAPEGECTIISGTLPRGDTTPNEPHPDWEVIPDDRSLRKEK